MATAKIEFVAGGKTVANTKTISAAHLVRLAAAFRPDYGQVDDGAGGTRDMTDTEVLTELTVRTLNAWKSKVKRAEQDAAVLTAKDGISDIEMT